MAEGGINTFVELQKWATQMEPWQRCLLSMLMKSTDLTEGDYNNVLDEFMWDKAVESAPATRVAHSLGLPSPKAQGAPPTKLRAIKAVVGVNALAPNQRLEIGPQLTVIYGPNGSGKSGYARIIKASCFTRSKSLAILGDINVPTEKRPQPSAIFEFDTGPDANFDASNPCPQLANHFAAYDSSCIRVYTDEKNRFNVTPYLFDVFPRMVTAIGVLNDKLKELIAKSTPDLTKLQLPDGTTEVAVILATLSVATDENRLKELAALSDEDVGAVKTLEAQLEQLRKTDPATLITQKNRASADFLQLEDALSGLSTGLSDEALANIKAVASEVATLREQAAAIGVAKSDAEPVKPIGTAAWRALVEAAIAYNAEAYPGRALPADVRCLLCQQPLEPEAKLRLARFFDMVANATERKLKDARKRLDALLLSIKAPPAPLLAPASTYRRSLEDHSPALTPKVEGLVAAYEQRRELIFRAVSSGEWPVFAAPETGSIAELEVARTALNQEVEALAKSNVEDVIAKLTGQLALLRERKLLAARLLDVLAALKQLRWIEKANKAVPISHRGVTERQKALMEQLIAKGFSTSFADNCQKLGLNLPLDFTIAGAEGETVRRLGLNTPGGANATPSAVLSEGEQTVAALADFLNEISLDDSTAGVIFDDPVSSMDHVRKEPIAKRLVDEALSRQVIIFTHDIIFSHYLATEAEKLGAGLDFCGRTVAVKHDGAIGCVDEIIFPHSHYEGEALAKAKALLAKAKSTIGTEQKSLLERACGNLRTAYENFVQRKLFEDIVGRWRENIKFTFKELYVPEDIVTRVDDRMSALSRFIEAHSHSEAFQEKQLTAAIVEAEIQAHEHLARDLRDAKAAWKAAKPKMSFS